MKSSLAIKNLKGRSGKSLALILLSLFLSFSILGGSLVLAGLKSGMNSLDARLGADIMVVPYKAATENYLEDSILMGSTGYYYMSNKVLDNIRQKIDGIAQLSGQIFLATTTSSCCSYKVSIVGFDPETDFTISPWIQNTYHGTMQDYEVFVGHDLNAYPGDTLTFFGVPVKVAARLDKTGTYLDTAVYTNMNTAKALVVSAEKRKLFSNAGYDINPDEMISCAMVKVADGYDDASVEGEIKTYIRQVATVKTETSVEDVSNKLTGIQDIAGILIVVIWALIIVIEIIAFRMNFNSRMKEFAVLRMAGASASELSGLLMKEAFVVSLIGSAAGGAAALLVTELFAGEIQSSLNMPFLLPQGWNMVLVFAGCVAVSVVAGILSALSAAHKAGKVDTALILRGDN